MASSGQIKSIFIHICIDLLVCKRNRRLKCECELRYSQLIFAAIAVVLYEQYTYNVLSLMLSLSVTKHSYVLYKVSKLRALCVLMRVCVYIYMCVCVCVFAWIEMKMGFELIRAGGAELIDPTWSGEPKH